MKRVIILLGLIVFAFASYAQDIDLSTNSLRSVTDAEINVTDGNNLSYVWKYGDEVSDTLNASDDWSYTVTLFKEWDDNLKYELHTQLDSVSGSPGVSMILQGKYSYKDSWTALDTVVWAGTSSDTTMSISYTSAKNYRFVRAYFKSDATAQKSQVDRVEFGVFK